MMRFPRRVWSVHILAALCLTVAGCTTTKIPMTEIEVPMLDVPMPNLAFLKVPLFNRGEGDLRGQDWREAFENMHLQLVREYPFTTHKAIAWDEIHDESLPLVAVAAGQADAEAFYRALRSYLYSIPDGQMRLSEDEAEREAAIGGGFGFAMLRLDDGRVVAPVILKEGAAGMAGMAWGAQILAWNGRPLDEALADYVPLWADMPPATTEGREAARLRYLTRAPAATVAEVTFRNPGEEAARSFKLEAVADDFAMLDLARPHAGELDVFDSPIQSETLAGGYGYIKIYFEGPTMTTPFPARVFRKAVLDFVQNNAPGLVIDVRGNSGGDSSLVPAFLGHFFYEAVFYQDVLLYNPQTGGFDVDPDMRLTIEPQAPYFDGPVVVIVDEFTYGAGEGIPMALQREGRARVLGFHATHGSFGITGGDIAMPKGIMLSYPVGRAVDAAGNTQLDSDAQGNGGVQPDVRLALDESKLRALYVDGADVLLAKAVELLGEATAASNTR